MLAAEAERMLADPKSRALVDNFAGQWLQLRDVSRLMPDPEKFPDFDGELRTAMRHETEMMARSTCDWVDMLKRAGHWPEPAHQDEVVRRSA